MMSDQWARRRELAVDVGASEIAVEGFAARETYSASSRTLCVATAPRTLEVFFFLPAAITIVSSKRRLRGMPGACWSSQSRSGRSQSRSSSFTLQFRWRTGCRVRRHWDQPDHHPDGRQPQRPAPRADQYGQRIRRRVIDLLVGDDHRHPDLRHAADARRQRRRGQHHGAHHAAAAVRRGAWSSHRHDAGRAGPLRRRTVLRREHDHPRDLAPVRSGTA